MVTRTVEWKGGSGTEATLRKLIAKYGNGAVVRVGFFESDRYTTTHPIRGTKRKPLPVAQVAFWNNFGAKGVPRRDFMGATVRGNVGWWAKDLAILIQQGKSADQAVGILGKLMQEDVVTTIKRWSQPPNSPRWAKVKGFNKPLIDDGTMQRAVGFQVNNGAVQK